MQIVLEIEDQALAHPVDAGDPLAQRGLQRRVERADEEGAGDAGPFERLTDDAAAQVVDVHLDVGQLGHGLTGL